VSLAKEKRANTACSGQGFRPGVRGGLLAMVLVGEGVLPVRPAANASRWVLSCKTKENN